MAIRFIASSLLFFVGLYTVFAGQADPSRPEPTLGDNHQVVNLTDANFNNYVLSNDSNPWLIMFFAPWCPHCKHAMPAFANFSNSVYGKTNVGLVDCDANPDLRSRFSVGGYPTFYYVENKKMYHYRGRRTVEEWTNFTTEGYKTLEGEEVPLEGSSIRNFIKELKRFFEQLKFLAMQKPLVFGGIAGGFILVIALTCFCGSAVDEKMDNAAREQAELQEKDKKQKKAE